MLLLVVPLPLPPSLLKVEPEGDHPQTPLQLLQLMKCNADPMR